MASVMARWSACILQNVCLNSLQRLMTLRGMKRAENTNVFIFAKTNDYKHFSQVNLFLAGFTSRCFFIHFPGSFILYCAQSTSNHIAVKRKTLPRNKWLHLPLFAAYKSMKMHDLFQQAINFPKIVQQSLLYLELRHPAWLLNWRGFMSTATQWCQILLTVWDWRNFSVNT